MNTMRVYFAFIAALVINIPSLRGADLVVKATTTNKSFLEGEPVFVLLSIANEGTNMASVGFGKFMLEYIVLSTSADSTLRQSKRLQEGGIHVSDVAVRLSPQEKYETVLLIDDWLTLPTGKPVLNIRIRWDRNELAVSLPVDIRKSSDGELEERLKQMILEMAAQGHLYASTHDRYRNGLKDACQNPRAKAALLRVQNTLTETNSLAILGEILRNYRNIVAD